MFQENYGSIYVISAPSGAGKTSLIKELLKHKSNIKLCTSHTTRLPRDGEIDGKDYFFISKDLFIIMQRNNSFVESAQVFGNYYGTSVDEIERVISSGQNILLEIDWQGARQVRHYFPDKVVSIFILPPSLDELEKRLRNRGKDSSEVILKRMAEAKEELSHASEYNYSITNDDFSETVQRLVQLL